MSTSPSNTTAVQTFYNSMAHGDVDTALSILAPDVEWVEPDSVPHRGVYRGPDGVRSVVAGQGGGPWDRFAAIPEEFVDGGDVVISLGHYEGTFIPTGKPMHTPFAHVWRFTNGQVSRYECVIDSGEVMKAMTPDE